MRKKRKKPGETPAKSPLLLEEISPIRDGGKIDGIPPHELVRELLPI